MENVVIGIDPGVSVGYAMWIRSEKRIIRATTYTFWELIDSLTLSKSFEKFTVVIEDVTQNKPTFARKGQNGFEMQKIAQNVGSNKRDCQLIMQWLEINHIEILKVKPTTTKWDADTCKRITGYDLRCSQHARDAIRLCYDR